MICKQVVEIPYNVGKWFKGIKSYLLCSLPLRHIQVQVRLLPLNFYTFSCVFCCIMSWPRLTNALFKRQLPALNPATGSSPSDIHDKSPAMKAVPL